MGKIDQQQYDQFLDEYERVLDGYFTLSVSRGNLSSTFICGAQQAIQQLTVAVLSGREITASGRAGGFRKAPGRG